MKGKPVVIWIAIVLFLALAVNAEAARIFVWDHNNGAIVRDQVFNDSMTVCESMTRTLDEIGLEYTCETFLPEYLGDYDLVIINLGYPGCG
ncbi:MAG TPA: hypothetical protein ENL08_02310 [Bacteroidetes bacterium]|nr:hypothetical protein [Bacteroidota bacterium]